jgi:acylphosphatase
MKLALRHIFTLIVAGLLCGSPVVGATSAQQRAITGIVSGEAIQKVGFRAMIQKHAIKYNLAGYARNNPDGTVALSLQGDKHRIDKVFEAIRATISPSS